MSSKNRINKTHGTQRLAARAMCPFSFSNVDNLLVCSTLSRWHHMPVSFDVYIYFLYSCVDGGIPGIHVLVLFRESFPSTVGRRLSPQAERTRCAGSKRMWFKVTTVLQNCGTHYSGARWLFLSEPQKKKKRVDDPGNVATHNDSPATKLF